MAGPACASPFMDRADGVLFAEVEIQIEGAAGWASSLRLEDRDHWLLDLFWGGRPMTGYHAWVFSFMFLAFHLGVFIDLTGR